MDRSFPAFSPSPELNQEPRPELNQEPAPNEWRAAELPVAAQLLAREPRAELVHLAAGLGFAALYGLALGARVGGLSLLRHALAASAGLSAVGVLGVPSLFVLLALADAPVSPNAMLAAGARALASTGFVLAGLAPSAALLVVSIESPSAAAFVARMGFALAGGIGLYQLASAVRGMLRELPLGLRFKSNALLAAFCLFAMLLAARVWGAMPILQGGA